MPEDLRTAISAIDYTSPVTKINGKFTLQANDCDEHSLIERYLLSMALRRSGLATDRSQIQVRSTYSPRQVVHTHVPLFIKQYY